jgi:hypothetical protein
MGKTALDWAKEQKDYHQAVVALLEKGTKHITNTRTYTHTF